MVTAARQGTTRILWGHFGGIAALGSVEKDTAKQPNDQDTLADVLPRQFMADDISQFMAIVAQLAERLAV